MTSMQFPHHTRRGFLDDFRTPQTTLYHNNTPLYSQLILVSEPAAPQSNSGSIPSYPRDTSHKSDSRLPRNGLRATYNLI
ncbi:hypothetical protein BJX68DRAFT_247112 [Aspergillus pseudodeflectus]|uniref:Uncharacterized protein n=1 Tax=Aspergillus pseudodeflectus TaxID=176178 RepID=A0ABR4JIX3_9EURO